MNQNKKKTSAILKEFGLTDDQIIEIALSKTLRDGISLLRGYMSGSWNMDTITAMKTVDELKKELN